MAAWMLHGASVGRKPCVFPCRVAAGGYLLRVSIYILLHLMISFPFWTICVNFNSFSFRKEMDAPTANANNMTELEFLHRKKHIWSILEFFETSNWFAQSGIGGYPWPGRWCYAGIWWNGWTAEQSLAARLRPKTLASKCQTKLVWSYSLWCQPGCSFSASQQRLRGHSPQKPSYFCCWPWRDTFWALRCPQRPCSSYFCSLFAALFDRSSEAPPAFNHAFLIVCLRNMALIWTMESMHAGLVILDHCPLWMLQTVSSQFVYWNIWRLFYRRTFAMRNVVFWNTDTFQNIVELDHCALRASSLHTQAAILLFDFRAAFPSLCQDFVLSLGVPCRSSSCNPVFLSRQQTMVKA